MIPLKRIRGNHIDVTYGKYLEFGGQIVDDCIPIRDLKDPL